MKEENNTIYNMFMEKSYNYETFRPNIWNHKVPSKDIHFIDHIDVISSSYLDVLKQPLKIEMFHPVDFFSMDDYKFRNERRFTNEWKYQND